MGALCAWNGTRLSNSPPARSACSLLQRRRLYPPELFERARLFGVDVPRPRHPELLDYVASALRSLRPSLRDGTAHSLSLLVTAPTDGAVLERHVFSLGFPVAATAPPPTASSLSLAGLAELERQLAGLLVRHALVDVSLPRLPDGARARASLQPLSHVARLLLQACRGDGGAHGGRRGARLDSRGPGGARRGGGCGRRAVAARRLPLRGRASRARPAAAAASGGGVRAMQAVCVASALLQLSSVKRRLGGWYTLFGFSPTPSHNRAERGRHSLDRRGRRLPGHRPAPPRCVVKPPLPAQRWRRCR